MYVWQSHGRHFHILEASTEAEYHAIEEMQKEVWGFNDIDAIPMAHLVAAQWAGGMVLCAYEGERMVGFAYGFPAHEHGRLSIHSHMLAVVADCRNLHAGFHLKLAQRDQALASGIDEITWTFDPLQSLNAHFNFGKLGVISQRYVVNFYGETTSSPLHQGFGTDRLWVRWLLNSDRVKERVSRYLAPGSSTEPPSHQSAMLDALALVRTEDDRPKLTDLNAGLQGNRCSIDIPSNINLLKQSDPQLGIAWREATREAFLAALDSGFIVQDFPIRYGHQSSERSYVLVKTA